MNDVRDSMCAVAPSPGLRSGCDRPCAGAHRQRSARGRSGVAAARTAPAGFNDGVLRPPSAFPAGADRRSVQAAAHERAPLRGQVRVLVVLVDLVDKQFAVDTSRFADLFFSAGTVPPGSVKEYFADVTGGLVDIVGEVVGPLRTAEPLSWYTNGNFGIGNPSGDPRAHFMAENAAARPTGSPT